MWMDTNPSINKKKMKKNCFVTFYHFLSLKNDENVPSKRNKHNNLYGSEDPDPYQNVTDQEQRKKQEHFFVPGCQRPCTAISVFFSLHILSVYSEYPIRF
jgi:hypothetical protein